MSALDLSSKTVLELRKIAKEQGVKLGAGISKAGIIAKLEEAMAAAPAASDAPAEEPSNPDAPMTAEPAADDQRNGVAEQDTNQDHEAAKRRAVLEQTGSTPRGRECFQLAQRELPRVGAHRRPGRRLEVLRREHLPG